MGDFEVEEGSAERVVDLVRDARSEHAHRRHPVGDHELLLGGPLLRRVVEDADGARDAPVRGTERPRADAEPHAAHLGVPEEPLLTIDRDPGERLGDREVLA